MAILLINKPGYTFPGLILVLLGILYFISGKNLTRIPGRMKKAILIINNFFADLITKLHYMG